jgi:[NiFe] hydrogenase assembly HybE family chaperone
MSAEQPRQPDPSAGLEALYLEAADRMRDLPVYNAALRVQAVGFAPCNGHWLGVVVTPWFMNLTIAPCDAGSWQSLPVGGKRRIRFPAGDYEFIGSKDPQFGEFQTCSLFSPMQDFADHDTASLVARLALQALLDPAHAEPAPAPAAANAAGPQGLSKRNFLRGRLGQAAVDTD